MSEDLRLRFAPSPTGALHIGGARTALYNWLIARHGGGTLVLRIEDTDRERSTQAAVDAILDGLAWLGLDADEPPIYQTQRFDRYREVLDRLLDEGSAYRCYCTREELDAMRAEAQARGEKPRYDGRWRPERAKAFGLKKPETVKPVVRFRTPEEGDVGWNDLVKGPISFPNAELDDLVLLRADGVPTYNFGVVVDDIDMNITHVIRGDDHVNNTPRQIHIFNALGRNLPQFAHVPMILGADGERLSKRHGAVSVLQYREEGYLPEALLNYLARLGWSHGDDEIIATEEALQWFDLSGINRAPARFDFAKLQALNGHYIRQTPDAELISVKVGGADGSADVSKVLAGIQWVVSFSDLYDIEVMNLSLGTESTVSPEFDPLNLAVHKVAPAIAAGCPIVLKPPSKDPLVMLRVAGYLAQTDLPAGAVSILPMDRPTGDRMVADERFKLLSHGDAVDKALERGVTRNPDVGQGNGMAGTLAISEANGGTMRVATGDVQVRVVGTQFEIRRRSGEVSVAVAEGIVAGGGVSFIRAIPALQKVRKSVKGEEVFGVDVVAHGHQLRKDEFAGLVGGEVQDALVGVVHDTREHKLGLARVTRVVGILASACEH